jgi:hypothetical protein
MPTPTSDTETSTGGIREADVPQQQTEIDKGFNVSAEWLLFEDRLLGLREARLFLSDPGVHAYQFIRPTRSGDHYQPPEQLCVLHFRNLNWRPASVHHQPRCLPPQARADGSGIPWTYRFEWPSQTAPQPP